MSLLDELIACVHYRILLCMDEGALSSLSAPIKAGPIWQGLEALWQRLAMCRDRLAAARFLGSFSPDARRTPGGTVGRYANATPVVTTEDPSPYLPCSRFVPSSMHSGASGALNGRSAALWTDLTDDGNGADDGAPNEPPPTGATLLGSQSPHVFWIGGDRLLGALARLREAVGSGRVEVRAGERAPLAWWGLAGGYSPDVVGGSAIHPLREIYLMDLPDISDSHATLTRPDLSVKKLDCGTANGRLPHGHPSVNGCACDFDALRSTIFFFGGGTPHAEVYHATSALRLEGWDGANPTAQWQVVSSPGSIESDEIPLARQGVKGRLGVSQGGTVYCDEFVIFGGRLQGGRCTNDVWSLNLEGALAANRPDD
ncbi:RING finger protein B [Durusdinium trenchii]|uniref:RING finger protein B n=1 Tax=Durusdinium trenchii TaxID=1381693 RepID=A0ABP0NDK9_9DINO